jgi:hypothetical protein
MAIYGIGAMFGRVNDVLEPFMEHNIASMDYTEGDAQPLRELMKHIKPGDIIYAKSYSDQGKLTIKAVGIVTSNQVLTTHDLPVGVGTIGVRVRWIARTNIVFEHLNDYYNVRRITLYEELNIEVQSRIIEWLIERFAPQNEHFA